MPILCIYPRIGGSFCGESNEGSRLN